MHCSALDFFRLKPEQLPAVRAFVEGQGKKYIFDQELTADNLVAFLNDWKVGKAKVGWLRCRMRANCAAARPQVAARAGGLEC